jgi:hypothetical protein
MTVEWPARLDLDPVHRQEGVTMRVHVLKCLVAGLLVLGIGVSLHAQRQRASPHEKVQATIDGAKVAVEYGRPYVKGRTIFGGLVPLGQVWRTGADEATTLVTDRTLVFGTTEVPPGTYTLYTIPGDKAWTLIVNKQTGQWGTQYTEGQDLARIPMTRAATAAPVEQLTIALADTPAGGTLSIEWADTRASVDFKVK